MTRHIGFIGLGIMGGAITKNILEAGYQIHGYDVDEVAKQRFVSHGGSLALSPMHVAQEVEIIFTSLPTENALAEVIDGPSGITKSGKKNIIVEISTMPIDLKLELEKKLSAVGQFFMDCPVSGTGAQAASKDLMVFASGHPDAYEKIKDIFHAMSKAQYFLGEFGNGSKMKFLANILVAIHNVAAAEVFALAGKAGINLQDAYEVLKDSAGASKMFQIRGPMMVANDYAQPTAKIENYMKDLSIISKFAASLKCPTPLYDVTNQLYYSALNQGMGQEDLAAVCKVMEQMAGVTR